MNQQHKKKKKHVHFASQPFLLKRHRYSFDWSTAPSIWYTPAELAQLKDQRFIDADILRIERGIDPNSREDADKIDDGREKEIYVGDTLTHALDDVDRGENSSLRGIEHFVWPVLQKEMVERKRELKRCVLEFSRDVERRKCDVKGEELASLTIQKSEWARNVASERGIKYCEMKRGGSLLKNTHAIMGRRKLDVGRMTITKRNSLIRGMKRMSVRGMSMRGVGDEDVDGA